jgi:hypothetical protein
MLGVLLLLATGARAEKAASFEDAIAEAQPAGDLAQLVEPFFAECKGDDDFDTRRCNEVRDWLKTRAQSETFWAVGDEAAIAWQPWDPTEKKLGLEISGCLACGKPITLDGKMRFVTTRVPKAIKNGHAVGLEVGFQDVPFKTSVEAAAFQKKMQPRLRVQFVFKLGASWKSGSFEGVTFTPTAYRVFDKCSGRVVASDPPSQSPTALVIKEGCPDELTPEQQRAREEAALPDQLAPEQINGALKPVKARIHDCFAEFQKSGTATLHMVIERDGKLSEMKLQPPFAKTDAGYCIEAAVRGTTFPRFKGDKMVIDYPFKVQ